VVRRDVGGFAPNLVVGDIIDFHGLHRQPDTAAVPPTFA